MSLSVQPILRPPVCSRLELVGTEEPWAVRKADIVTRHAVNQVTGSGAGPQKAPMGWVIGSLAKTTMTAIGRLHVAMVAVPLAAAAVTTTEHFETFLEHINHVCVLLGLYFR